MSGTNVILLCKNASVKSTCSNTAAQKENPTLNETREFSEFAREEDF